MHPLPENTPPAQSGMAPTEVEGRVVTAPIPETVNAPAPIDWIKLALTLREPEIEILRLVYFPEPATRPYLEAYQLLERLGYSERTARRKIALLASKRLVGRLHSVLGFIAPVPELQAQIGKLLDFLERRRMHHRPGPGFTAELMELMTGTGSRGGDQP